MEFVGHLSDDLNESKMNNTRHIFIASCRLEGEGGFYQMLCGRGKHLKQRPLNLHFPSYGEKKLALFSVASSDIPQKMLPNYHAKGFVMDWGFDLCNDFLKKKE